MMAPSIVPATQAFPLPAHLPAGAQVFEVVRSGSFAGHVFSKGERLIVDGAAQRGDAVVLVARGRGRPRLGQVRAHGLVGDLGEPCLERRWAVAGRLLGVASQLAGGWQVSRFDEPEVVGMVSGSVAPTAVVDAPAAVGQLDLFAA